MVPEMGPGHRAGGADLASGVDTAGTVAKIDLRLPHHPLLGSPLLTPMRPLESLSGSRPPGLCGDASAAPKKLRRKGASGRTRSEFRVRLASRTEDHTRFCVLLTRDDTNVTPSTQSIHQVY